MSPEKSPPQYENAEGRHRGHRLTSAVTLRPGPTGGRREHTFDGADVRR